MHFRIFKKKEYMNITTNCFTTTLPNVESFRLYDVDVQTFWVFQNLKRYFTQVNYKVKMITCSFCLNSTESD